MVQATHESLKARAKALGDEREALERRLMDIASELETLPGQPGMQSSLVDAEGFPRSDVDIHRVRLLRQEHIRLSNDAKLVLKDLHSSLAALHEAAALSGTATEGSRLRRAPRPATPVEAPFALISAVDEGSPAAAAGVAAGDRICSFGPFEGNGASIQQIAAQLQGWKDTPVMLVVLRRGEVLKLELTPKEWSGPGLLGCKMSTL